MIRSTRPASSSSDSSQCRRTKAARRDRREPLPAGRPPAVLGICMKVIQTRWVAIGHGGARAGGAAANVIPGHGDSPEQAYPRHAGRYPFQLSPPSQAVVILLTTATTRRTPPLIKGGTILPRAPTSCTAAGFAFTSGWILGRRAGSGD